VVESLRDDSRIDYFNVFDVVLEHLAVVVVPSSHLHVKYVVVELSDAFKVLIEHVLKILEGESPFFTLSASKDWHLTAGASLGKLKLTFADFFKIFAALDKGLIFCKDSLVLLPFWLARAGNNTLLNLGADCFPLVATIDALIKVAHALFNIPTEHVFLVNLFAASGVDLIADLSQKTFHAVSCSVFVTQLPDDSHAGENIGDETWNLGGLSFFNLSARVLQNLEEFQIAGCLVIAELDLLFQD